MSVYQRPLRSDELYHYGVKGMHWGVRRYRNEDGSYTGAGRARYNIGEGNGRKKMSTAKKIAIGAGVAAGVAGAGALGYMALRRRGGGRKLIGMARKALPGGSRKALAGAARKALPGGRSLPAVRKAGNLSTLKRGSSAVRNGVWQNGRGILNTVKRDRRPLEAALLGGGAAAAIGGAAALRRRSNKNNYRKSDRIKSAKGDSSVTKRVKNDYNNMSDADFKAKYKTSRNTYRKRVNRHGDPYTHTKNSAGYKMAKAYSNSVMGKATRKMLSASLSRRRKRGK